MVFNPLKFKYAEEVRDAITKEQQKEIVNLYEKWANELEEKAKYWERKSNGTAWMSEIQVRELQKQLRATSRQVSNEVYGIIKQNLYIVSDAVVSDAVKWAVSLGFPEKGVSAAYSSVPDYTIRNLITGNVYKGGWSLSARIWGNNEETLREIYGIVAQGMSMNMPVYDISKALASYVRPSAAKGWNPLLRMKNTKTGEWEYQRIYKKQVDYNAQRLARTLAQHTYQQTFVATTKENPFILKYRWIANGSRVCEICADRDGQYFEKDALPLDHPNGMCTMEPVIDPDLTNKLVDWYNSEDGTYPEIDKFAENFGYKVKVKENVKDANHNASYAIDRSPVTGKDIATEFRRDFNNYKFEIEDVINRQGYDGLPKVVNKEEFDRAVKESNFVAQRAYTAPTKEALNEYQNQLYNGKWYVDCSNGGAMFGQGMYTSSSFNGAITDTIKNDMQIYSQTGGNAFSKVESITMTKDAKIISSEKLDDVIKAKQKEYRAELFKENLKKEGLNSKDVDTILNLNNLKKEEFRQELNVLKETRPELINVRNKINNLIEDEYFSVVADKNATAALLGYDAVNYEIASGHNYTVILNRTKCIFLGE